jgi:hypothetical protein
MPLCPQITNTPITVTQTADFTVTSVVPVVADTQDGLAVNLGEVIASSGNQTYRQLTPPTQPPFTLKIGDIWFDTDDGNKEYRWDGTNWISVQDGSIATKNRTYYSATAPTGSDLVAGDIWFDTTTGNKPYRWSGSAWISVQDASIATALSTANAAQTTANGKNKVIYSLSAASGTGTTAGDIWWQYNSSGIIIAQWEWTGSAWSSKTIGSAVIANLDAGKITAGTISVAISLEAATITGGSININSGTFVVTSTGAVTITATNGININSGTFQVSSTGAVTASNLTITGGSINVNSGVFTVSTTGAVSASNLTITGGSINVNSGVFAVSTTGAITSTSGTIAGWTIGSTSISKTVGTKTMTLDSSNAILTISDSSSGILAGGGINITSGSTTGSYGAGGFSFGGQVSISLNGSDLYLQGGATSSIRLSPGAGLGSTTYWVQVEGHLNSAAYTLSTGTYDSSSTASSTGTYLSATGAMIARRDNQIPIFAHRYNNTTSPSELIRLNRNGVDAGGITTTSGGVPAFRNASDYRLKSNIEDYVNSTQIIKGTRLRSFVFNTDPGKTEIGFIAHEFAEVLPDLVMGEKDAIDEDGNPIYQSITATSLIPYLTGALKDIILRVEALEEGK